MNDGIKLSSKLARASKKIRKLIPENIGDFVNEYGEIGCPDCRDQCGIYLGNDLIKVHIDPEDYPKELEKLINEITKITNLAYDELF